MLNALAGWAHVPRLGPCCQPAGPSAGHAPDTCAAAAPSSSELSSTDRRPYTNSGGASRGAGTALPPPLLVAPPLPLAPRVPKGSQLEGWAMRLRHTDCEVKVQIRFVADLG